MRLTGSIGVKLRPEVEFQAVGDSILSVADVTIAQRGNSTPRKYGVCRGRVLHARFGYFLCQFPEEDIPR